MSFKEINNKSNINNNKSYDPLFSKQGNQIIRIKEQFSNNTDTRLINKQNISSINTDSKKQHSFKENFESNQDNPNDTKFYFPNMIDVNSNIDDYTKRIKNADTLITTSNNLLNDTSIKKFKNTYSTELNSYKALSNTFNTNTKSYLTKANNKKNVYVTSLSTNKDATFKGLYNYDSNHPSMNVVQTSNYDDCKNRAFLTGKKYFGLTGTDTSNTSNPNAKCLVSDTLPNSLEFTNSCKVSNGYTYGGSYSNAIYRVNATGTPNYLGCYQDQLTSPLFNRVMYPASWILNWFLSIVNPNNLTLKQFNDMSLTEKSKLTLINNPLYKKVYFTGNYNNSTWNVTNFRDIKAQWIWYTPNSTDGNTETCTNKLIFGAYLGPTNQNSIITGNIYCCCDNSCIIKVNGQGDQSENTMNVNGWGIHNYKVWINPYPYINIIELYVTNGGGPAGVILSILDDSNRVICRTTADPSSTTNPSSDVGGSCTWLYSPTLTTVQVPGETNHTVTTCSNYAKKLGYQYIGLQYLQENGKAQCFVSNVLSDATKKGSLDGYVTYNSKKYGLNTSNAVYEINATTSPSLLGKVGYINENNKLSEYPPSMISYSDTYETLPGYGSNANTLYRGTPEQCKLHCKSLNKCNGFTYSTRQKGGYFSTTNKVFDYRNSSEPLIKDTDYTLYMRNPAVNNNQSCSKIINNITADDWRNYTKIDNMKPETTCGLYKSNQQIKQELDTANTKLFTDYTKLLDNTKTLINTNRNLNSQIVEDKNIITESSSLYDKIDKMYTSMIDNNNLNNIFDNSNLVIKQSQYYYIIWIILILLIIIGVIIILRRI